MEVLFPVEAEPYLYKKEINTSKYQPIWSLMHSYITTLPKKLRGVIHKEYFDGLRKLELTDKIPTVDYINNKLAKIGWRIVLVNGFLPSYVYVKLQQAQIFPVSCHFRQKHQMNFSPIADFLHDIYGHLPFLFSEEYRTLLRSWYEFANKCTFNVYDEEHYQAADYITRLATDPNVSEDQLSNAFKKLDASRENLNFTPSSFSYFTKFYTWFFEFGVCRCIDGPKTIGAAVITSLDELNNLYTNINKLIDIQQIDYKTDIEYSNKQSKYYQGNFLEAYNALLLAKNKAEII